MKKWDRSLGTSKREQGIITPKRSNKWGELGFNAALAVFHTFLDRNYESLSEKNKEVVRRARMGDFLYNKFNKGVAAFKKQKDKEKKKNGKK